MPRTLRDDRKADFYNVFLNTGEFAETVTFYPARGGPSRRIVVIRSVTQRPEQGELVTYGEEQLRIRVGKDETHAKGGIAVPVSAGTKRDMIQRDDDTETERYAYTGEKKDFGVYWELEFSRRMLQTAGVEHRQR